MLRALHWIIFTLAFWTILVPFVGDDIARLIPSLANATDEQLMQLLRWDDLIIGLSISILALLVVTLEQPNIKTAGLRAMHWMQFGLGVWIATAPFALFLTMREFTWSHFVTGLFVAIFALVQVNLEDAKH